MTAATLMRRVVPVAVRRRVGAQRAERRASAIAAELQRLAAGTEPIVAGPWLGEVGYELLYWVPFLSWFAAEFGVEASRIHVLSRGGTRPWYSGITRQYLDVFDEVSPAEFRQRHDERVRESGEQKQKQVTAFERGLIDAATRAIGGRARVLHPSTMYDLLYPYWWGHVDESWVFRHARYRKLSRAVQPPVMPLPASYTAAKFYFNDCFPDTEANRAFVTDVLRDLSRTGPVVSLTTGLHVDDHRTCDAAGHGILTLPPDLPPQRNLAVQTAIVAGADAFVGTYGGFSYLAPFHGVRATAYYSVPTGFSPSHLTMARAALTSVGARGLLELRGVPAGS